MRDPQFNKTLEKRTTRDILVWDVKDKDNYTCKHHVLLNPKPFITIDLTPKGKIPKSLEFPSGSRLRLATNNNLPLDVMRKAIDVAKSKFKPESITFLNRASGNSSVDHMTHTLKKEDLRDIAVQEEFIDEYLKDYEANDQTLEKVYELNRKYNATAEEEEEITRNVNWNLKKFSWDNLFNYGEGNSIDFNKLNGVVGVFGKNFSGKSSIIDGLLYAMYNSTSKNERKNLNIINQNKQMCSADVEISVGDDTYSIHRESEKYLKKLKGEETLEAKTKTEFTKQNLITQDIDVLNGTTRNETDKNIKKVLGTMDDFLMTSMSSQMGSLSYINEGSTKRKEILAKFLDLDIFEKKFKLAKDDASDLRGALKTLEGKDYDEDIKAAQLLLNENTERTEEQEKACAAYKVQIEEVRNEITALTKKIESMPANIINIVKVVEDKEIKSNELQIVDIDISEKKDQHKQKLDHYQKIIQFLDNFDIDELETKKELINDKGKDLDNIISEINIEEREQEGIEKKVALLSEVPCGSEFSHCRFIRDAYTHKKLLPESKKKITLLNNNKEEIEKDIDTLQPDIVDSHLAKYNKVVEKKNNLSNEMARIELDIEKSKSKKTNLEVEIKELEAKFNEYEENKEVIENLEILSGEKRAATERMEREKQEYEECRNEILELYKQHGSLEQRLNNLVEQQTNLEDLRTKYTAYDLFMRCMHSNGISYDIIKKRLPIINDEISKVLANVVDFEVFFENDGNKLDIFIKHPKHDPRPIEMGSGAEKTIAAMAIRLALLSVSSLPKSNLFILDEPATALDAENMEGFVRIVDMVKNYYQIVLLISHVDSLKDIADTTIEIEKNDGFAFVSQ
jgi:DNA repair exonuclease SbcCD ATPase subunit